MNDYNNYTNSAQTMVPYMVMPSGQVAYWRIPVSRYADDTDPGAFEARAIQAEMWKFRGWGWTSTGLILLAVGLPVLLIALMMAI